MSTDTIQADAHYWIYVLSAATSIARGWNMERAHRRIKERIAGDPCLTLGYSISLGGACAVVGDRRNSLVATVMRDAIESLGIK